MTVVPADAPVENLRKIPSVERILQYCADRPPFHPLTDPVRRRQIRDIVRVVLDQLREEWRESPPEKDVKVDKIIEVIGERVRTDFERRHQPHLRSVINATGVVLHTNLGRAPLASEALSAVAAVAGGYSNLEYDLDLGKRGHRDRNCEVLLRELLDCEAAVVVNNCAAAVLLVLDTFCPGNEVLISRGELIEIGGGFRIPDVMRKSGAILREVGTTNRTRLSDYEAALTPQTRMILRVHPSNFRLVGFSASPSLGELSNLAKRHNVILFEDTGSGALTDFSAQGLDEPLPRVSLAAGADVVTFSGDKLLGGPQAGIIGGRKDIITPIRTNPLMRALRVDKMTYAALEATLRLYLDGKAAERVPALAALTADPKILESRARRFAQKLRRRLKEKTSSGSVALRAGASLVGGGSAPEVRLPTTLVALRHAELSANTLEEKLRLHPSHVIGRVEDDWVVLDLRTVFPNQEPQLIEALTDIF